MKSIFAKKKVEEKKFDKPLPLPPVENLPTKKILIIDSDSHNWHEIFAGAKMRDGFPIEIQCCEWDQMAVSAESGHKPLINIKPNKKPRPNTNENEGRTFQPDFVIVRKLVQGLTEQQDYTNVLFALMASGVPSVNSFMSIYRQLHRPVVYAALRSIHVRLGNDFPLIPMTYYSHGSHNRKRRKKIDHQVNYEQEHCLLEPTDDSRAVVLKIGSAEAGYGKLRFENPNDAIGTMGLIDENSDFFTLEHFVEGREYDIRVQRIGPNHLRAYKRVNANWKGNVGQCILEEIPVTEQFKKWSDEAANLFGGMEILTVDAIHTKDGKDCILEINDTASGFAPINQKADMIHLKELALQKMAELKC